MTSFDFGICATQGQRSYQEDSAVVWPGEATFTWDGALAAEPEWSGLLAVLADGMGGHVGGALASRTVCEAFVRSYVGASQDGEVPDRALSALFDGNARITEIVGHDRSLDGMGSTLVGAVFGSAGLEWVSVGDSPLYLVRREEIALLNEDHSLAPALDKLAAEGRISKEEAKSDPRRHMLRSAITGEELDLIDVSKKPLQLEPGDYVIVASDGIHTLEDEEVVRLVSGYGDDGPLAVAQAIIRAIDSYRAPHQDNATVIAVRPDFA